MSTQAELELAARRVNLCLGAEQQLLARNAQKRRLPVTIVTGFLGAGKTSLLQHILQHKLNLRVACAVSDLAAINVDALLVANQLAGNGNKLFQLQADPNSSLAAFKDAVWQVLNEDDDAAALGHVDYLVMETSGTTDPTQLVAAVQEKFGQMTRARLDSVVTVVDGDAVAQDAAKGLEPCAVAVRQLRCADVVLLNKVDLLDDDKLKAAKQVITKYAPSARVYETDHGKVFLPHVLDIAPPDDAFNGGVSHEKVQAQWNTGLSALNGAVTPAPSRHRIDRGQERVVNDDAPSTQAFASVAYERAAAIPLAAVHDWIQHHLPLGTLRAKGVMYIAELPKYRFVVQLSGKRRLEVENAGVWQSTPKTQLVVIGFSGGKDVSDGDHFDEAQALESLEACLSKSPEKLESEKEATRASCLAKLKADERFDTLVSSEQATTVAFRLTCPTSTLDETMLRHHHHVDMNELTKRLVREVNAGGGGSLLLYATSLSPEDVEGDQVYAVASIIGPASVLSIWSELDSRAELIINEVKKKLAGCLCGF